MSRDWRPPRANPNRDKTLDWKPLFLAMLVVEGTMTEAAKAAGVNYRTVTRTKEKDDEFSRQIAAAQEMYTQRLERELYRRAMEGNEEPVHFRGQRVDTIRRFSDTLLIFALKARRPEVYRDANQIVGNLNVDNRSYSQAIYVTPDEDRRREVAEILGEALSVPQQHSGDVPALPPPE